MIVLPQSKLSLLARSAAGSIMAGCLLAAPLTAQTFEVSPPAAEAARLFQKVCVVHQSRLSGAETALENLGFILDATGPTWFHPTYDLSFAVRPQVSDRVNCSMVWSSVDSVPANVSAIAAVASDAQPPEMFDTDLMRTLIHGFY